MFYIKVALYYLDLLLLALPTATAMAASAARLTDAELDRQCTACTIAEDWYRNPEGVCHQRRRQLPLHASHACMTQEAEPRRAVSCQANSTPLLSDLSHHPFPRASLATVLYRLDGEAGLQAQGAGAGLRR